MPDASVVEGEQPITHLPLAWGGDGQPRAQVQHVTQLFLGDPGDGELLPVPVMVQRVDDLENCTADRCSRLRTSRFLMPYSGCRSFLLI